MTVSRKIAFKSEPNCNITITEEITESAIEIKEEFPNDPFASLETLNNCKIISITPHKCSICQITFVSHKEVLEHACVQSNEKKVEIEEEKRLDFHNQEDFKGDKNTLDIIEKNSDFTHKKKKSKKRHVKKAVQIRIKKIDDNYKINEENGDLQTKRFKCKYCNEDFSSQFYSHVKLKQHVDAVHKGKKVHNCSICDKIFSQKVSLQEHTDSVHEKKIIDFDHKGKRERGVFRFRCSVCDKLFTRKHDVKRHMDSDHEKKKPNRCSLCEYRCPEKGTLKRHIESVHEKKKPHKCSICYDTFSQRVHLNKHIQFVHGIKEDKHHNHQKNSEEKNPLEISKIASDCIPEKKKNKCSICDKIFSRKSDLKRHTDSVHAKKKPNKCSLCKFRCSEKSTLKRHIESVHEKKKPHKCSICDYSVYEKYKLNSHIQAVHEGKKPFKCDE